MMFDDDNDDDDVDDYGYVWFILTFDDYDDNLVCSDVNDDDDDDYDDNGVVILSIH